VLGWFNSQPLSFLGNTSFVNFAIMGAQVWTGLGFAVIVLSAALKAIPADLTEAAKIDGANAWQIFSRITVPLIWPTVTVIATLTMIGVLKIFDIIYTMTGADPRERAKYSPPACISNRSRTPTLATAAPSPSCCWSPSFPSWRSTSSDFAPKAPAKEGPA
jgi:ABC-type sugar transport system permease subunit